MAWVKDTEGNLVNLDRCGIIRTAKVPNSSTWRILAYSEGNDQYPFAALKESDSERDISVAMELIRGLVNIEKLEIGTVN